MKESEIKSELWQTLADPHFDGELIIKLLSHDKEIRKLFEASAGVKEGYTVEEHTLKVFKTLEDQIQVFKKRFSFKPIAGVRLQETLKMLAALHDIGKPLAIAEGDKARQHEFTVPILLEQFEKFDFTKEETRLAKALVGHDYVGEMVKERATPEETYKLLKKQANFAHIDIGEFMPLQVLYYVVDAASYPMLRLRIFTLDKGMLVADRPHFHELLKLAGMN